MSWSLSFSFPACRSFLAMRIGGLLSLMVSEAFAQAQVADTRFSTNRGFYTSEFSLVISTETPGATIYYTLDGSEPSESNGFVYTEPIVFSSTSVVRAMASSPGMTSTNVDTHTYLFPADIVNQAESISGYPRPNYGTGGGGPTVRMDYEMDPVIVNDAAYSEDVIQAFAEIPSLCISVDPGKIFGEANFYDGENEEEQVAIEVLYPDDPEANEKVEGGVESHSHERLKRSLRLNFRSEYGEPRWKTELFRKAPFHPDGRATPNEVKRVILRAGNNRAWSRTFSREKTTYALDEFARLTQIEMDGDGMRGAFVHLFINGIYWGLYNPVVRADTFYTSATYGGDESDWFAVNHGGDLRGNDNRFDTLKGSLKNEDMAIQENYEELTRYLDVNNLIDYLLLHWYTNTGDWPRNNWYGGLRNSSSSEGPLPMKFFAWDGEWSWDLPHASIRNIAPDPEDTWVHPDFRANDGKDQGRVIPDLFNSAKDNPLFLRRLADRAYLHLANGGALSDAVAENRFAGLTDYLENAVVAESARWGDALDTDGNGSPRFTRNDHWAPEVANILSYMDGRAEKLIEALREEDYYPSLNPPILSQHGGEVSSGFQLEMSPEGSGEGISIYYTLDGSDPAEGGAEYDGPISLVQSSRVLARSFDGDEWSAAADAVFLIPVTQALLVSEIHYHPGQSIENHTGENDLEYLELHNPGTNTVTLSGAEFTRGITLRFEEGAELGPGETAIIVGDTSCFVEFYGSGARILGDYSGRLSNDGERLSLVSSLGQSLIDFTYNDIWHPRSDGDDYSLQLANPTVSGGDQATWSHPSAWIDSGIPSGTPGELASGNLSFDNWLQAHEMLPGTSDRDFDFDGYPDLLEYALGSHPLRFDQSLITLDVVGVSYELRNDRGEVTITPQLGESLMEADWNSASPMTESRSGFVDHRVSWPVGPKQFFRLKVDRP